MGLFLLVDRLFSPKEHKRTFLIEVEGGEGASIRPWRGRHPEGEVLDLRGLFGLAGTY